MRFVGTIGATENFFVLLFRCAFNAIRLPPQNRTSQFLDAILINHVVPGTGRQERVCGAGNANSVVGANLAARITRTIQRDSGWPDEFVPRRAQQSVKFHSARLLDH